MLLSHVQNNEWFTFWTACECQRYLSQLFVIHCLLKGDSHCPPRRVDNVGGASQVSVGRVNEVGSEKTEKMWFCMTHDLHSRYKAAINIDSLREAKQAQTNSCKAWFHCGTTLKGVPKNNESVVTLLHNTIPVKYALPFQSWFFFFLIWKTDDFFRLWFVFSVHDYTIACLKLFFSDCGAIVELKFLLFVILYLTWNKYQNRSPVSVVIMMITGNWYPFILNFSWYHFDTNKGSNDNVKRLIVVTKPKRINTQLHVPSALCF